MIHKLLKILATSLILFPIIGWGFLGGVAGQSSNLASPDFHLDASRFFPTGGDDDDLNSSEGLENINVLLEGKTPVIVLLMGTMATIVIVIGGIMLTTASGKAENAGKAKTIITTAIIAMIIGLGAYVIIAFLGNFIDV